MEEEIYSSTQSINKLLGDIFTTFPTVYNSPYDDISLDIVVPLYNRSKSYCNAIKNDKIAIIPISQGGFSKAGPFYIYESSESGTNQEKVYLSGISFMTGGGWKSYFMEVWGKTTIDGVIPPELNVKVYNHEGMTLYKSSDPIHEGIIGALLSHLFDIGATPSVMKYMGLYICDTDFKTNSRIKGNERTMSKDVGTKTGEVSGKTTFVFEKSDIEFLNILGGTAGSNFKSDYAKIFMQTNPFDYIIWLTQLAHTFYTMKEYFGICHFDLHLRNVMFTYVKNTGAAIKFPKNGVLREPTPFMYDGKLLKDVDYYAYQLPMSVGKNGKIIEDIFNVKGEVYPTLLFVENNGFLPKLIDFGISYSLFNKSEINKNIDMAFTNEDRIYKSAVGAVEAFRSDINGNVEYNFILANLLFQLYRNFTNDKMAYNTIDKTKEHVEKLLDDRVFRYFMEKTFGFGSAIKDLFETGNTGPNIGNINGKPINLWMEKDEIKAWFMRFRNVGTSSDIQNPLKLIWKTLLSIPMNDGQPRVFIDTVHGRKYMIMNLTRMNNRPTTDEISNAVIIGETDKKSSLFSDLNKFMLESKKYWNACIINGGILNKKELDVFLRINNYPRYWGKSKLCSALRENSDKLNPSSTLNVDFFKNLIGVDSPIWNRDMKSLKVAITDSELRSSGLSNLSLGKNAIQLFTLRFQPNLTDMEEIAFVEHPTYDNEQRMLDYRPPPTDILGSRMKNINARLVYIDPKQTVATIRIEGTDLFNSASTELDNAEYGAAVNGGFFIVGGNMNNLLTPGIKDKFSYPIGYFYNKYFTKFNGTTLPFPNAYRKDMAIIYTDKNNTVKLMKSDKFMKKHMTEKRTVYYRVPTPDGEVNYASDMPVIKMEDINGEKRPVIKEKGFTYNSALESGPILIWNGDIIFDREKMNISDFVIDMYTPPAPTLPNDAPPNTYIGIPPENTPYKVALTAQNYKMYFNEPRESNFLYGQRSSNSLMIHNVICETFDNKLLFVFVEGRGFDAIGLDRPQLAELVYKFNVKNAVSLDGGFSANTVFKTKENGYQWLLHDPDKRALSSVLFFKNKKVSKAPPGLSEPEKIPAPPGLGGKINI